MTAGTYRRTRLSGELDLRDLVERRLTTTALLVFVVAAAMAVWCLPGPVFHWQRCLGFGTVSLAAASAWLLRGHGDSGTLVLVAALLAVGGAAAVAMPAAALPLLVLAVAAAAISTRPGLPLAAGLAGAAILALIHLHVARQDYPEVSIVCLCLVGAVLSLSARSTIEIMRWFWHQHDETVVLAGELRDRQGQLNRTIKALDLAYRLLQHTNHELAEVQEQALEAQRQKERFTANISHELRTPLNLILGFSEVMYMSPEVYGDVNWSKPLRRDVARVYEASRHLSRLVDDVLDLSRVQLERLPLHREMADVGPVVREAAETVAGLIRGNGVRLAIEIDPFLPKVEMDVTRIRQVVVNLLTNAIRFTDEGQVTVRVRYVKGSADRRGEPADVATAQVGGQHGVGAAPANPGDEIVVSVSDTGAGVPAAELEAIFNEFHQAESAARRQGGGAGLGLAISRKLVIMHGGRIWAVSEEGRGSTFTFTLPAGDAGGSASTLRLSGPLPLPGDRYGDYLLLLNCEADAESVLQRHLGGYRVVRFEDWREDQELAGVHPRAAVCNLLPTSVASIETLLPGVAIPDDVPIVFCCVPSTAWRREHLGVAGSLQKPVRRQDLLDLVQGLGGVDDVLVVDDDRGFVQLVVRWLEAGARGRRARFAFDGEGGLAEMRRARPQVVLLDLRMPGLSGVEVLQEMRADATLKDVPVAVLTGVDVEEDLGEHRARVVGMLQKEGWGLSRTLDSVAELLRFARPSQVMSSPATPESLAGLSD